MAQLDRELVGPVAQQPEKKVGPASAKDILEGRGPGTPPSIENLSALPKGYIRKRDLEQFRVES